MTFPIVLPHDVARWNLPKDDLKKAFKKYTSSSLSGFRVILAPFANAAREMGIPNSIAKIVKGPASYISTFTGSLEAKNFAANCTTFSDVVKVFSLAKGVDDILANASNTEASGIGLHQRNLGIASGIFQTIISGAAIVKVADVFSPGIIAEISNALGTTTVLPFSVFTNGLEIVKNVVDITNKSLNIHKTNKKLSAIKAKYKQFNVNSTQIGTFLTNHIQEMETKQKQCVLKEQNLRASLLASSDTLTQAYADYTDTLSRLDALEDSGISKPKNLIDYVSLRIEKWQRKTALFNQKADHDKLFADYTKTRSAFSGRVEKYETWKAMQDSFNDNGSTLKADNNGNIDKTDPLYRLLLDKKAKWKTQRRNGNLSNLKDGLGIAISVAATIGLIAAIVLTFSGVGTIPAAATMTTIWLLIAIGGLINALISKYTKPVQVPVINFPAYIR